MELEAKNTAYSAALTTLDAGFGKTKVALRTLERSIGDKDVHLRNLEHLERKIDREVVYRGYYSRVCDVVAGQQHCNRNGRYSREYQNSRKIVLKKHLANRRT